MRVAKAFIWCEHVIFRCQLNNHLHPAANSMAAKFMDTVAMSRGCEVIAWVIAFPTRII